MKKLVTKSHAKSLLISCIVGAIASPISKSTPHHTTRTRSGSVMYNLSSSDMIGYDRGFAKRWSCYVRKIGVYLCECVCVYYSARTNTEFFLDADM